MFERLDDAFLIARYLFLGYVWAHIQLFLWVSHADDLPWSLHAGRIGAFVNATRTRMVVWTLLWPVFFLAEVARLLVLPTLVAVWRLFAYKNEWIVGKALEHRGLGRQ